jgi:small conductance mechanosensitive channel
MFLTDVAENINEAKIDWQLVLDKVVDWCTTTGIKVLISLIIWFISWRIINIITKKIYKHLQKRKTDATLSKVLCNVARIALKIIVVIGIIGYVGIETASISAVVASAGVGLSLAVQGTLANFAGGVIIIVMRPFKLGDFITSNDQSGTVEDIKLFYTQIVSPDNKVIYIPNAQLANNVIVNISVKETRRVEVIMPISYSADVELAKRVIKEVALRNSLILQNPAPFAEVAEYGDSSINIKVRVWCKNADYWNVNWYLLSEIKTEFDNNNIEIPFTQIDVNIKK